MFSSLYIDDRLTSVRRVRGLGAPAPRRDVSPRASRHGAVDLTRYYEGRVIDLEGALAEATQQETWEAFDDLKEKLQLGATRTLRFTRPGFSEAEQLDVIVASVVDDNVVADEPGVIRWGVSLFAADPRIYGATLRAASYDPAAALAGGGVTFPLTFPVTFSVSTVSLLEILVGGNAPTPPVLTLRGPANNPTFDNDTTDKSIQTTAVLGSSDTLSIDVAARTVTLNGASRPDLFDVGESTWWELARGTNRLRVRGTGMSVGSTLFTCQYRNARI